MELKISYTGPLLIHIGTKADSVISEIDLTKLKFKIKILGQEFETSMEPLKLGEIPLTTEDWRYFWFEELCEKTYSNFVGDCKLTKELTGSNYQDYHFLVSLFDSEKLFTGQQIRHLLSLD